MGRHINQVGILNQHLQFFLVHIFLTIISDDPKEKTQIQEIFGLRLSYKQGLNFFQSQSLIIPTQSAGKVITWPGPAIETGGLLLFLQP